MDIVKEQGFVVGDLIAAATQHDSIEDYKVFILDSKGKELTKESSIAERIKDVATAEIQGQRQSLKRAIALGFLYRKIKDLYPQGVWELQFQDGGALYGFYSLRTVQRFIRLASYSQEIIDHDCISVNHALSVITEIENGLKVLPEKPEEPVKSEYDFKSRFRKITEEEMEESEELEAIRTGVSKNGQSEYYVIKEDDNMLPAVKRNGEFYIFNWQFLEQSIK